MIRIQEAVIVEGKYDKIKLSSFVEGLIITTDGFRIFKDKEKMRLLRKLARKRGLLILTDSDAAGFVIRNRLIGCIDKKYIKHCYIPDISGKERRKEKASAEGKLGVEGMSVDILTRALQNAGVRVETVGETKHEETGVAITKQDFYEDGLSGGPDSSAWRKKLLQSLRLPERMGVNAMVDILNATMSFAQYKERVARLFSEEETEKIGKGQEKVTKL